MKKIILVLSLIYLTGCTAGGFDTLGCYDSVREKYPESKIVRMPDSEYKFIVIQKNGGIRHVKTMNMSNTAISFDMAIK